MNRLGFCVYTLFNKHTIIYFVTDRIQSFSFFFLAIWKAHPNVVTLHSSSNTLFMADMKDRNGLVPALGVLGVCIIIAVFIFSAAFKQAKREKQKINITGSAKLAITSDLGILSGTISTYAGSQSESYKALESRKPTLLAYLASQGFPKDKVEFLTVISIPVTEMNQNGYSTGNIRGYTYSQRFVIQSADVKKIQSLSLELPSLVERGVDLQIESPQYMYTKLADVKIQVQAEASKDAMMRAKRIAEATGSKLGPISDARMGVLQITAKNSNEISDYGVNDVSSIEKEITAVMNASFALE